MPQFAGLVLLGLALVWAKQSRHGRLGLAIGLHAGLVWGNYIINAGQLVQYSGQVPAWVTGIDKNPLAGMMGLLFLSGIALRMRQAAKAQEARKR
jgi:threonine/homoserine efflux transporter RhtA